MKYVNDRNEWRWVQDYSNNKLQWKLWQNEKNGRFGYRSMCMVLRDKYMWVKHFRINLRDVWQDNEQTESKQITQTKQKPGFCGGKKATQTTNLRTNTLRNEFCRELFWIGIFAKLCVCVCAFVFLCECVLVGGLVAFEYVRSVH